jgi:hypothetical protein
MFLNDMLENCEKENLKFFNSGKFAINLSEKVIEKVETSFLSFSAREGLFNICEIILGKIKFQDIQRYKKFIEVEDENLRKTILMEILPKIKKVVKFSSFLDEIFKFYDGKVFEEFLMREDADGNTILHLMTEENVKVENFEIFSNKLLGKIENESINFKKLLFHQNLSDDTFLHFFIKKCEKNFEKKERVFDLIKICEEKEEKEKI